MTVQYFFSLSSDFNCVKARKLHGVNARIVKYTEFGKFTVAATFSREKQPVECETTCFEEFKMVALETYAFSQSDAEWRYIGRQVSFASEAIGLIH